MRTRVLQEHSDLCGFIDHDVIEGYMFTGLGTDKELALQLCETSSLLVRIAMTQRALPQAGLMNHRVSNVQRTYWWK